VDAGSADGGGGQWGTALALVCSIFDLERTVSMVESGSSVGDMV
jgi:predicted alternative tryptophan synthase beta-subunit